VLRDEHTAPIRVTMTCGMDEDNHANNRVMRHALARQSYEVRLHRMPGRHGWSGWREALDPHLLELVEELTA
jgi:enterochelin esterase family protein